MPRPAPSPTRPLQSWNLTTIRLRFAPSDRGLTLSLNRCRCRRCRLRVFFREVCRVTAISAHRKNKNPDVSAAFFRLRTLFHSHKAKKGPFCSCLLHFLSRDLRIGTTRQSAIAKKLHPDPIFCFWAPGIVSGWHRGAVAMRAAKQKPGISLACMSENDAPPCGPQILEMQRAPLRAPSPHKQPHSPARLPFGELRSPLAFTFPLLRAPQHVVMGATLLLPQARAVTC